MTTLEPTAPTPQVAPAVLRLAPALFASTLFLSALLLFLVQPMFTKLVLPRLGGAPTVWSVAMVFFQAALLAGYALCPPVDPSVAARRGRTPSSRRWPRLH